MKKRPNAKRKINMKRDQQQLWMKQKVKTDLPLMEKLMYAPFRRPKPYKKIHMSLKIPYFLRKHTNYQTTKTNGNSARFQSARTFIRRVFVFTTFACSIFDHRLKAHSIWFGVCLRLVKLFSRNHIFGYWRSGIHTVPYIRCI